LIVKIHQELVMAHLELALLGPFQAKLDGAPIAAIESNKGRALLAYLAVEVTLPHYRTALAELMWPAHLTQPAQVNLRRAIYNLRQALGDRRLPGQQPSLPLLLVTRETVQFNRAADFSLDVADLSACMEHGSAPPESISQGEIDSLEKAAALYRGPFMEGFTLDSPTFEEWLVITRERLNREISAALVTLATLYESRREYGQAQYYARRRISLDPWQEEAHRQLMRTLAWDGQRSAAIAQYASCRQLLFQDLGVAPEEETTHLYKRIRAGELDLQKPALWAVSVSKSPDSESEPPNLQPVFVARQVELDQLNHLVQTALSGQGQVAFVVGDAGSGKTALVNEFARRSMDVHDNLVVAGGHCTAARRQNNHSSTRPATVGPGAYDRPGAGNSRPRPDRPLCPRGNALAAYQGVCGPL
jgi:DNA-binding SARP family transcriptional activator